MKRKWAVEEGPVATSSSLRAVQSRAKRPSAKGKSEGIESWRPVEPAIREILVRGMGNAPAEL